MSSVPTVPQVLEHLKTVVDSNPETRQQNISLLETLGYLLIAVSKSLDSSSPSQTEEPPLFDDEEISIPGQNRKVKAFAPDDNKEVVTNLSNKPEDKQ
jgi:hypothetical protein